MPDMELTPWEDPLDAAPADESKWEEIRSHLKASPEKAFALSNVQKDGAFDSESLSDYAQRRLGHGFHATEHDGKLLVKYSEQTVTRKRGPYSEHGLSTEPR